MQVQIQGLSGLQAENPNCGLGGVVTNAKIFSRSLQLRHLVWWVLPANDPKAAIFFLGITSFVQRLVA